jgi:hypothetical protein
MFPPLITCFYRFDFMNIYTTNYMTLYIQLHALLHEFTRDKELTRLRGRGEAQTRSSQRRRHERLPHGFWDHFMAHKLTK